MKRIMVNMSDELYEQFQQLKTMFSNEGYVISDSNLFKYCFKQTFINAENKKKRFIL